MKELRRLHFLPVKVQEEIYHKTVVCSITSCISVRGTSSPATLDAIDKLHSRAAKIIHEIKEPLSVEETLNVTKWVPISYIFKKHLSTWMHKIYHKTCHHEIYKYYTRKEITLEIHCSLILRDIKGKLVETLGDTEVLFFGTLSIMN